MCGRFALSMTPADLAGVFGTRNAVPNFQPNWNLPPSQPAPVVRHNPKTGERSLDVLRWGLIPHFERDPAHARMLNNARAETVAKLPPGVSKTWGSTPRAGLLGGQTARPAPPP